MATVRTGARGTERDIGPAAGYGGSDNGRLASLEVRTPADMRESAQGSGPVEVRHETEQERVLRVAREFGEQRSARIEAPHTASALQRLPWRAPKEEPVAPEPIPMIVGALPCSTCAHRPVCRIPETVSEIPDVRELEQGVLIRATWQITECEYWMPVRVLTPVAAPTHDRPAMGSPAAMAESRRRGAEAHVAVMAAKRQPGKRFPLPRDHAERLRVVVEAVLATPNAREAAAKLGVSESRVGQILTEARREGTLPAEVDTLLRSRGANPKAAS